MSVALIMAGGTGGHIFPAAAVAEQLKNSGYSIRWLGSKRGMEKDIVPQLGYQFHSLPISAWHGSRVRKLLLPWSFTRSLISAISYFRAEKPAVVIGFGGYASAPGGIAAWLLRIPLVLHEQNAVPGMTNKLLEGRAARVLQAFPGTFDKQYPVVGNPVRTELTRLPKPEIRLSRGDDQLRILVLGGSQGAEFINQILPRAIGKMTAMHSVTVCHQAGQNKLKITKQGYSEISIEATVVEFIDDMSTAYGWCDVVVARSGASTVSELAATGIASILIPYPWHIDKQQYKNAQWLASANASVWFEQEDLSVDHLARLLDELAENREKLLSMSVNAWQLGIRDSAVRVNEVVDEVLMGDAA